MYIRIFQPLFIRNSSWNQERCGFSSWPHSCMSQRQKTPSCANSQMHLRKKSEDQLVMRAERSTWKIWNMPRMWYWRLVVLLKFNFPSLPELVKVSCNLHLFSIKTAHLSVWILIICDLFYEFCFWSNVIFYFIVILQSWTGWRRSR